MSVFCNVAHCIYAPGDPKHRISVRNILCNLCTLMCDVWAAGVWWWIWWWYIYEVFYVLSLDEFCKYSFGWRPLTFYTVWRFSYLFCKIIIKESSPVSASISKNRNTCLLRFAYSVYWYNEILFERMWGE